MSKANGASAGDNPPRPVINILGQYVRDLSFENFARQDTKLTQQEKQISIGFDLGVKKIPDNRYEVITKTRLEAGEKESREGVFLVELEYAGLFQVTGLPADRLQHFLLIECPRLLFPFVRRILNDLIMDGGYAPVPLNPVEFEQLFRQELARYQARENK